MDDRKGRKWTWQAWEASLNRAWKGNYATASALTGLVFLALLTFAIVLRSVSPSPIELDEFPLSLAKREAAKHVFRDIYMSDCELAAQGAIKEPFRTWAKKTGMYSTEAFPAAIACLESHLASNDMASLDVQLRANRKVAALLDLSCVGDLRSSELCERAFDYAKNRGAQVGESLAAKLIRTQNKGFSMPGAPPMER